ncbi:hypothetical protein [Klenkia sp. PcliD-1-E]|nr:hypothetical protein [Klenkia sp. PcliD-1-E]MCO7220230.1 hypothetical protein [Klenkia sp. PcliD-1-E]
MAIALLVGWVLLGLVLAVGIGRAIRIADQRAESRELVVPFEAEVTTAA